jgi:hypothetical protein
MATYTFSVYNSTNKLKSMSELLGSN